MQKAFSKIGHNPFLTKMPTSDQDFQTPTFY